LIYTEINIISFIDNSDEPRTTTAAVKHSISINRHTTAKTASRFFDNEHCYYTFSNSTLPIQMVGKRLSTRTLDSTSFRQISFPETH